MESSRKRAKLTGKGAGATFFALPHYILRSAAYRSLSHPQRSLLVDVGGMHNGTNNGDLAAQAPAVMGKLGWRSKDTLTRAVKVLVERGLLEQTRQGGRHAPSLYALTWLPIDACKGKLDVRATTKASHKWKQYSQVSILGSPSGGEGFPVGRTTDTLKVVSL